MNLHLERLVRVLLAVDGEVAVGGDGLDAICVRLEVVLLWEVYTVAVRNAASDQSTERGDLGRWREGERG